MQLIQRSCHLLTFGKCSFAPFKTASFQRCFLVFCVFPKTSLCPKQVSTTASFHAQSTYVQSCAGFGSPPALGEYTSRDGDYTFLHLQLYSLHVFGERELCVSKFSPIYNFSARNSHSLLISPSSFSQILCHAQMDYQILMPGVSHFTTAHPVGVQRCFFQFSPFPPLPSTPKPRQTEKK